MVKKVAPTKGTAVVPWDEEVAKLAEQMGDARKSGGGGSFIGISASGFSVGGEDIGPEMNVVILDYVNENQYYDTEFDRENPQPPVCFAFARNEADLKPRPASTDPQHETCAGCPQNAYGTDKRGKGKACKNVMRLAIITEGDLEDIEKAEVHLVKISVTNVKHFTAYMDKIRNPNLKLGKKPMPFQVVTTMTAKPHKENQIILGFEMVEEVPAECRGELLKKVQDQLTKTITDYSAKSEEAAPPPKASKFTKKKK